MRNLNSLFYAIAILCAIMAFSSCSESEKETPSPAELQKELLITALKSNPELSQFTESFQMLDFSTSDATGLTILAPTNDALVGIELTEDVLKRHILENAYLPSDLLKMTSVKSINGLDLIVKTEEGITALNNTPIGLHLSVGNSILYTLNQVIPSYNTYLGLGSEFTVTKSSVLRLRPETIDLEDATFEWSEEFEGTTTVVANTVNYDFITLTPGTYTLTLKATKPSGEKREFVKTATVIVTEPDAELSPYINQVIDFLPAPGINLSSYWNGATTREEVLNAVYSSVSSGDGNITLGAFGGYMVVGFDHTIINIPGLCDFTTKYGGGNNVMVSPSIIWVAFDANGNGMPDEDEWFEIKGSEYGKDADLGIRSYTYNTTQENNSYEWNCSNGTMGAITPPPLIKSPIPSVPFWITDATYTLSGRELDTYIDPSNMFANPTPFAWGYAGNQPNDSAAAAINIDWAVDADGNSVHLPGVDFIKVVNATQKMRQMQGECRYQVASIEDLHLRDIQITDAEAKGE